LEEREIRAVEIAEQALDEAGRHGASAAEVGVDQGEGFSVTVRQGELETIEHNRDKSLGVTVYCGRSTGSASTSDFSSAAVRDTVKAACTIARYTAEDKANGLADQNRLATSFPDLELYHPWELSVEKASDLAFECEASARNADKRIVNSEGATLTTHGGQHIYANSHGFIGVNQTSRHSISCAVIGREGDSGMQRDFWYSISRLAPELDSPAIIGQRAAQRTLRRLGGRQVKTCQVPVLFEAPVASSLLSHFIAAIRGSALYRNASFLQESLGEQVFSSGIRIHEQPHLKRALGSTSFDNEGVATVSREIVEDGVLNGYVLDSYSARRLGLETTGNAGGVHNLTLDSGELDFDHLLGKLGTGLLVTELLGHGINGVTGDYSRGAAGFWVEKGEISHPVDEITIAGNLKQMFRGIRAVGSDVDLRRAVRTGSILVDQMTVAGE
jgi:PmbA protein